MHGETAVVTCGDGRCLDATPGLSGTDKQIAERPHAIVSEEAPHRDPKTWYGFPSYAREGEVIVFFQPASKFDTRCGSVGFNENAQLDDGVFWPTAYAVLEVTAEVETALGVLVLTASR